MSLFKRLNGALKHAETQIKSVGLWVYRSLGRMKKTGQDDTHPIEPAMPRNDDTSLSQSSEIQTPSQQDLGIQPIDPQTQRPIDPSATASNEEESQFPPLTHHNFLKHPIFWARFLGYAIPLSFLLYVLYLNYLPFGYHKTFTINVGSPNDTKVSEFYLEPSADLSDRMTAADGTTYRELNGMATAVFKPNAVLKNANITVEVKGGDGISLIPPVIDFDPDSVKWDYSWDFSKGVPKDLINDDNKAFAFEGGTYFNGDARVEMASSSDMFEDGPFTVYAEWMPTDDTGNGQQIVGHFNWELWQNSDSVIFRVGRMNDSQGPGYQINYQVDSNFFNKKHSLLAIYKPATQGYIELYIDDIFVGRKYIGSNTLWKDYGKERLTLGWTPHNYRKNPYLKAFIYQLDIANKLVLEDFKKVHYTDSNQTKYNFEIATTESTTTLKEIKYEINTH